MRTLFTIERSRWRISLHFDLHDLWVGLYWQKYLGPRIDFWFILIPALVLHVELVYRNVFKQGTR